MINAEEIDRILAGLSDDDRAELLKEAYAFVEANRDDSPTAPPAHLAAVFTAGPWLYDSDVFGGGKLVPEGVDVYRDLPDDFTKNHRRGRSCYQTYGPYVCTREDGHGGRWHVAGDGRKVVGMWREGEGD